MNIKIKDLYLCWRNNLFKSLKLFISMVFAPKYRLKGNCKQCGRCCRNIVFYNDNKPITEDDDLEKLIKEDRHLISFYVSGKNEKGELLFTCKSLGEDNKCRHYWFRSLYCRRYPLVKSLKTGQYLQPEDYCGYKIVPVKSFKDYL